MKNNKLVVVLGAVLAIALMVGVASAQTPYESLFKGVLDQLKDDTPWGIVEVEGAFDLWTAEAAFFLDVRTSDEYEAGHIPGAAYMSIDTDLS
ncbi:rhodanese-like domain-containing protein, partial [Candidatus Bipolaricaulota bacterium]|nr:rhodanese-like domain-containing protein [Candidatus Bipolaricaulota bacterium]